MRAAVVCSAVCAAAAMVACAETPTELVVVVGSDLVPGPLDMVHAEVLRTATTTRSINDFALTDSEGMPRLDVPFSFVVVPGAGGETATITVALTAFSALRDPLFSRRAETGFRAGHRLLLQLDLLESCRMKTCAAEETCNEGRCVSPVIHPDTLDDVEPGEEF